MDTNFNGSRLLFILCRGRAFNFYATKLLSNKVHLNYHEQPFDIVGYFSTRKQSIGVLLPSRLPIASVILYREHLNCQPSAFPLHQNQIAR